MKLEEYNPKAKCSKCGYKTVGTIYCDQKLLNEEHVMCTDYIGMGSRKEQEHLHRVCERCKFEWIERCI